MLKPFPILLAIGLALLSAASWAHAPAKPGARKAAAKTPTAPTAAPVRVKEFIPAFMRVETPAEVLSFELCPKPEWPRASLRNEESGVSTLYFTVSNRGEMLASGVFRSSGFRDLDRAALNALQTCKFKPGSIDGEPMQTKMLVQYVWTLE
jgi:periplasmic protein TonB